MHRPAQRLQQRVRAPQWELLQVDEDDDREKTRGADWNDAHTLVWELRRVRHFDGNER